MKAIYTLSIALFIVLPCVCATHTDSLKQAARSKDKAMRIKALSDLCWELRFSQPDTALKCGMEAIKLAQADGNQKLAAQALNDVAIVHIIRGDLQPADSLLNQALLIERQANDSLRVAAILNKLGIIAQKRGQLPAALEFDIEALRIYEALDDIRSQSMLLNNIAIIHNNLGQFNRAREVLRHAYRLKISIRDSSEAAGTLINLGNSFSNTTEKDSALHFYLEGLEMLLQCDGSKEYIAGAYNSIGREYYHRGKTDLALTFFEKAIAFRAHIRDKHALAVSYSSLGDLYLDQGQLDRARECLDSARAYGRASEASIELTGTFTSLSRYYMLKNDAQHTYHFAMKAYNLRDSLLGEENRKAIAEAEARFELEKKQRSIAELSAKAAKAELSIANQRNFITLLVSVLILIVAASLIIYYHNQKAAAAALAAKDLEFNKTLLSSTLISQEEERQRIAKDLHDGLVQSIAALKLGIQHAINQSNIDSQTKPLFERHMQQLDQAAEEARMISHQMMPRTLLEAGLVAAMNDMLEKTLGKSMVQYTFEHFGIGEERFAQNIEVGLFRIAQEIVNNIIRHSEATRAVFQLYKTKTHLILHAEDNGKGFRQKEGKKTGIGIHNIYSRAGAVNGEVNFSEAIPSGASANVRIPLN